MVGCEGEGLRRDFFSEGFEGETGTLPSPRSRLSVLCVGELDELPDNGDSGGSSRRISSYRKAGYTPA